MSGNWKKLRFLKRDAAVDFEKSIAQGAIQLPGYSTKSFYLQMIMNSGLFDNDKPIKDFSEDERERFFNGEEKITVDYKGVKQKITFEGIKAVLASQHYGQ